MIFNFAIKNLEKYFPQKMKEYTKKRTDIKHESKEGVKIWTHRPGSYLKHELTFDPKNKIQIDYKNKKIFFKDEVFVYDKENDEKIVLISEDKIEEKLIELIKWKDGRSDTAKNMMIGNYQIRANITYETFVSKREALVKEVINCFKND